jgi:membrane protein DedA with SNARE-associated domain
VAVTKRKTLKSVLLVAAACWTAFCLFFAWLGAGMSVSKAHIEVEFFLYWLVPIVIPAAIYFIFVKFKKTDQNND